MVMHDDSHGHGGDAAAAIYYDGDHLNHGNNAAQANISNSNCLGKQHHSDDTNQPLCSSTYRLYWYATQIHIDTLVLAA